MAKKLLLAALGLVALGGPTAQAQCPAGALDTLYFSNFSTDDGGFTASGAGDWAYGIIPDPASWDTTGCSTLNTPPPGAYSDTAGWGTVLNSCYTNSGDTSGVGFSVDLSGAGLLSANLSFAQWYQVFVNFDYTSVLVNGTVAYRNDTAGYSGDWVTTSVDLGPWLGQADVRVEFMLYASTVVNRAGWYIDDVAVTACVDGPTGVALPEPPGFRAWPIPAPGLLHVQPSRGMGATQQWTLRDSSGRILAQGKHNGTGEFSLEVPGFRGLGILEMRSGPGIQRMTVVFQ